MDSFDLERFLSAQAGTYDQVISELRAGRKRSHWMWFIFPQLKGLGHSATAQHYAVSSLAEAEAYLAHPVLGKRLLECVTLTLKHRHKTASHIFGYPDDLKFRSCLTLFDRAGDEGVFTQALGAFYDGEPDERTLALLNAT